MNSNKETVFESNEIKKIINSLKMELLRSDKAFREIDSLLKKHIINLSKYSDTQDAINLRNLILKKQEELSNSKKIFSESKKTKNTWNPSQIINDFQEKKTKEQTETKENKLTKKLKIKNTVISCELVQIIGSGYHIKLQPTLFPYENVSIADFLSVIAENIPETKKYYNFRFIYHDTDVVLSLRHSKVDLVRIIKNQILTKYPTLKEYESVGKKLGKQYLTKFTNDIVKRLERKIGFKNLPRLIKILQNNEDIFLKINGLKEFCDNFQEEALINIAKLKAEAEQK